VILKRIFSLVLFSIVTLAWQTAVAGSAQAREWDPPNIAVTSDYKEHPFHLLAPAVALEKGFFEDVTVKIVYPGLGPAPTGDVLLSKMEEAGVDLVVDARPRTVFTTGAEKEGLYLLGGWTQGGNSTTKVVAGKDIKSLSDFRGKRIGTSKRESENAVSLAYWLHKAGLNPDRDVQWVVGLSRNRRAAQALRGGKVDIGFINEKETPGLEKEGYHIVLDWAQVYPEGRPERVIVATRGLVQKNPEAVKGFLKGMIRAYRLINDWERNLDFLKPVWQQLVEKAKSSVGEHYETTRMLANGMVPIEALQRVLDEGQELGEIEDSLRLDSVVNLKLMQEAVQELREANIWY